jgi:hypothetical protein
VRIGIKPHPPGASYAEILRVAWEAEDAGPESVWGFDRYVGGRPGDVRLEAWTVLTALALQTRTIRLGVLVSVVAYRHPSILANLAATLDVISRGRLEVGLGAGSPTAASDFRAYGLPFPGRNDRLTRLGEAREVLRLLWTREAADFAGRFYRPEAARCGVRPMQRPQPPIVLGEAAAVSSASSRATPSPGTTPAAARTTSPRAPLSSITCAGAAGETRPPSGAPPGLPRRRPRLRARGADRPVRRAWCRPDRPRPVATICQGHDTTDPAPPCRACRPTRYRSRVAGTVDRDQSARRSHAVRRPPSGGQRLVE